ncbi:hypothetical protein FAP39_03345 [Shimia litoralis]|uniref:Glutamine amidotransferase domain-containing protein n=1 Tax=Shimia litoralis TaxID=420403 RepID=A0A4U7N8F1_9RHOB|nr:hypothetical protein [Shimia litoralis]TKZ22249.1 hypothetical protein FAP39_03345 [Shimia litoralis]
MTGTVLFTPLLPVWALVGLTVLTLVAVLWAWRRGLTGWSLRGLAGVVILAALCGPELQREFRTPLSDIVLMLVDQSSSQTLLDRGARTDEFASTLSTRLGAQDNVEVRRIDVPDGANDTGTELMQALTEALAQEPNGRIAGVFALSDGRVHDMKQMPALSAPFHLMHSGLEDDWDRRLSVRNAPAFAILGDAVTLTLRIEDSGAAPVSQDGKAPLDISVDGDTPLRFRVPIGEDIELPVTLPHAGRNVIQFSVPNAQGEITDRNNSALIQINGVRDRLRVLLVSGEPHPGGRTWRNLLKSDASVDLVHFTILRPPEKQDGVPVGELSLIAFPTRELFMEKIDDFDLIVFDRYQRRGILPSLYLENVVNYVRNGGAVLVAAGPDFASADSLYRSPLAEVLPARPTARVIDDGYVPVVSDIGRRHPVTAGLPRQDIWGRWLRQVEVEPERGDVVMTGHQGRPLLILDRVDEGRVALLASDHAWLWARGYEGGGPQLELLRRLAHWMMGEPDLEEEALWAEATGQRMRIIRRSLKESVGDVVITTPTGERHTRALTELRPGHFEADFAGDEIGLYRLKNGDKDAVIGLGPAAPLEFVDTIATASVLAPAIKAQRGGSFAMSAGVPSIRSVRSGRPAAGNGWVGITPRNAYDVRDVARTPMLPAWLVLAMVSMLIVGGWLREGRR